MCFKVQALWALYGTNRKAKLAISLNGWLGRYTNLEYLQSLPEEIRTITVPSLRGYNTTLLFLLGKTHFGFSTNICIFEFLKTLI